MFPFAMLGKEVAPPPMSYSSRHYVNRYIPSNRFPVGLKWLLISNIAIFVVSFFLDTAGIGGIFRHFLLVPSQVVTTFAVWQVVTYMFLHLGFFHILWNMLALWMFGAELERIWGTERFLKYYFSCGIGAALCIISVSYIFGTQNVPTLGSSGAVYGILLAYALMFPDRVMLFGFLIPIKVKYFVMIIGAIAFMNSFRSVATGVSDIAHLGGLLVGFLILRGAWLKTRMTNPVIQFFKDWKMKRARKKFEVYLRKKGDGPDRWVH